MGIFDIFRKEETNTNIDSLIRIISDKEIKDYLLGVKNKKYQDLFGNEQFFLEVIFDLSYLKPKEREAFGSNFPEIMENLSKFYLNLAPLREKTYDIDKIKQIFLSTIRLDGIDHYKFFDKDLYRIILDKDDYTVIMNTILESDVLCTNIPDIVDYISNNRQYFNGDNFLPHILNTLSLVKQRGTFSKELKEELKRENRKRIGIYDIDETTLAYIDARLNGANAVMDALRILTKSGENIISLIEQKKVEAMGSFDDFVELVSKKLNGIVENSKLELTLIYNEYLQMEKTKITNEGDSIVRDIYQRVQQEMGKITSFVNSVENASQSEIRRIREEGTILIEKLREIVNDSPKLRELLDTYQGSTDVLKALQEFKQIASNTDFEQLNERLANLRINNADIVFERKDNIIENIPPVSFYLNESKKYSERIERLLAKKNELISKGYIFHEKFDDVLTLTIEGANPYLWGPSGSGKTYLIKQIADILELPLYDLGKINESYDILGFANIKGEYNRPLFFQAYLQGGVALADELDASNPNAVIILNNFASGNKEYNFPYYGKVERHPNFRLITAGNTSGDGANHDYNVRLKLEESLQQRLIPIEIKYDNIIDKRILINYPEWFEFSQLFRQAIEDLSEIELERMSHGNFTTRDAANIKKILDNQSLSEDKIMKYFFVQTKDSRYLNSINERIEKKQGQLSPPGKKLLKQFKSLVEARKNDE